jgi:hypothetical protein
MMMMMMMMMMMILLVVVMMILVVVMMMMLLMMDSPAPPPHLLLTILAPVPPAPFLQEPLRQRGRPPVRVRRGLGALPSPPPHLPGRAIRPVARALARGNGNFGAIGLLGAVGLPRRGVFVGPVGECRCRCRCRGRGRRRGGGQGVHPTQVVGHSALGVHAPVGGGGE